MRSRSNTRWRSHPLETWQRPTWLSVPVRGIAEPIAVAFVVDVDCTGQSGIEGSFWSRAIALFFLTTPEHPTNLITPSRYLSRHDWLNLSRLLPSLFPLSPNLHQNPNTVIRDICYSTYTLLYRDNLSLASILLYRDIFNLTATECDRCSNHPIGLTLEDVFCITH